MSNREVICSGFNEVLDCSVKNEGHLFKTFAKEVSQGENLYLEEGFLPYIGEVLPGGVLIYKKIVVHRTWK
jgi:hypothetical protein